MAQWIPSGIDPTWHTVGGSEIPKQPPDIYETLQTMGKTYHINWFSPDFSSPSTGDTVLETTNQHNRKIQEACCYSTDAKEQPMTDPARAFTTPTSSHRTATAYVKNTSLSFLHKVTELPQAMRDTGSEKPSTKAQFSFDSPQISSVNRRFNRKRLMASKKKQQGTPRFFCSSKKDKQQKRGLIPWFLCQLMIRRIWTWS